MKRTCHQNWWGLPGHHLGISRYLSPLFLHRFNVAQALRSLIRFPCLQNAGTTCCDYGLNLQWILMHVQMKGTTNSGEMHQRKKKEKKKSIEVSNGEKKHSVVFSFRIHFLDRMHSYRHPLSSRKRARFMASRELSIDDEISKSGFSLIYEMKRY